MLEKGTICMNIDLKAICGDAIIELKKIESNSVDLIVTDPPYNLNKDYGNNSCLLYTSPSPRDRG